jgi:S-adenosylmethionine synthetase
MCKRLADARKNKEISYLRPDGKGQVTVEYKDGKALRIASVVLSTQHDPEATHEQIEKDLIEKVIKKVLPAELIDANTEFFINPTGRFVVGGPQGDSGLTGRKILLIPTAEWLHTAAARFRAKIPPRLTARALIWQIHCQKPCCGSVADQSNYK